MEPLPEHLVARLDVAGAVERELASRHSLLPPIRGLDVIAEHAPAFSQHLRAQLRDGLAVVPADVVDARKQRHGIRPLAVMTVEQQILYRCLTEIVLADVPPPNRSPRAYVDFVQAPIYYAASRSGRQRPFLTIFGSDVTHLLKSDIAAFYQYVDHAVLRNELLTISADFDAVDALLMLLREVQGRDFGLPQLYFASDWLSEVYIDVLERHLLRRGLAVWRFNDDFRVACVGYPEVLSAIEQLDAAARDLGLVVNEFKTVSPRYETYVFDALGVAAADEPNAQLPADDVEALVGDYTEIELESPEDALALVRSVSEDPEEG